MCILFDKSLLNRNYENKKFYKVHTYFFFKDLMEFKSRTLTNHFKPAPIQRFSLIKYLSK